MQQSKESVEAELESAQATVREQAEALERAQAELESAVQELMRAVDALAAAG